MHAPPDAHRHRRRLTRFVVGLGVATASLVALAGPAMAQDEVDPVQVNLDNVWVLLAAVLVIFMQAGFALVEAGLTRAKSVANIMMKNLIDFCAGAVAFFAVGFAIAYGGSFDGSGKFFGGDGFFLGDGAFTYGNLTVPVFFMFQVAFAATAATIVSGAMAERTKFKAYLLYSFIISLIIYPVVVRWQWGGGWLFQGEYLPTGFHDFAGSSIVHMVGGITAFWGARALGPRIGKFGPDGKPRPILGHSIPFAILGCFILLVGWYGFNPGSELAADAAIGGIAVTTTLAGAMGALTAMTTVWIQTGKPDVGMTGNGLLAGLVAITAGTAAVTPQGALIIGGLAGVIVVLAVSFVERVLKVDDPVGAVAVHGVCGAFGTICVGLFARTDAEGFWKQGLFYGGGTDQLVAQVIGVLAIAAWVSVTAILCFAIIKATVGLRVTEEEELMGLDIFEHGSAGYGADTMAGVSVPGASAITAHAPSTTG
ncbi:MAG: ammonium transporter [Actinomycetota bacterium]